MPKMRTCAKKMRTCSKLTLLNLHKRPRAKDKNCLKRKMTNLSKKLIMTHFENYGLLLLPLSFCFNVLCRSKEPTLGAKSVCPCANSEQGYVLRLSMNAPLQKALSVRHAYSMCLLVSSYLYMYLWLDSCYLVQSWYHVAYVHTMRNALQ